ncbi:MAG: nucleotidyltransferase domain-containing protein, partial [Acidobacteria bacterium]|nr:nucleotidyltransferase domain-containing protein [Acidobacteriota bacterium]
MSQGRPTGFGPPDVKPLTDRFVETLRNSMGDRLLGVTLYGSVARGEARPDSDVDLLVVHRGGRVAALDAVREARWA